MFIVGGGAEGAFTLMGFQIVKDPFKAELFQFMGGEDVTPELYGEKNTNSFNRFSRDVEEMGWFHLAQRMGIPCVGICRGGQFLNVMCGGKMKQDVPGHTHNHILNTAIFGKCEATSTHHQMMIPSPYGKLIGWGETKNDVEIVWYETENCLCFQPHPEYYPVEMPELSDMYTHMIDEYLFHE